MSETEEKTDVVRKELAAILDCSEQMLVAASAGEWERVAEIEGKRKNVYIASLQDVEINDIRSEIQNELQNILDINRKILELADSARDQLASEIRKVNAGRAAAKAYKDS